MKIQKMIRLCVMLMLILSLFTNICSVAAIIPGESNANHVLSLSEEQKHSNNIWMQFGTSNRSLTHSIQINNPGIAAKPYIPNGAICSEILVYGDVIILDYRLSGIRYLVSYYRDGRIEKICRAQDSDLIYSINSTDYITKCSNLLQDALNYSITDEEANSRIQEMIVGGYDSSSMYSLTGVYANNSVKVIDPAPFTSQASTAPYKAKIVMSGSKVFPALAEYGYAAIKDYRIYETMAYHVETRRVALPYAIGTSIASIALSFAVPTTAAEAWLTAGEVAISVAATILDACEIIRDHSYTFLGSKECGIYDTTQWNAYVETYFVSSSGKISVSWVYNSSTGYTNPTWGHVETCQAFLISNSEILANGEYSYCAQVIQHGFWTTGVGNGFGY